MSCIASTYIVLTCITYHLSSNTEVHNDVIIEKVIDTGITYTV